MNRTEYSIGQVSKLLGLSVEGIRNYERAGVIQSERKPESNYRTYCYLDITSLIRARIYRSLGFSLQETEELTNKSGTDDIAAAMTQRREALEKEQKVLSAKQELLRRMVTETETLSHRLGIIEVCTSDAYFRIEFSKDGVIDFSDQTVAAVQRFVSLSPFAHVSTRYCGDHVYGGLAIPEEYAEICGLEKSDPTLQYLPQVLSLRTTVREEANGFSDISCIQSIKEFAEYHRFSLTDNMYGHSLAGVRKKTDYQRYRQIDAPLSDI